MTQKNNKPFVVHMDVRKLKREPDTTLSSFSKAKLEKLIEEAEEQVGGFFTMMEEHLALPSPQISSVLTLWWRKWT
jgi:hypothetical protein